MNFIKNLTTAQKIALTIAILGFVAGASAQLTNILAPFGSIAPVIVSEIVSLSVFVSGILGIVLMFVTGQGSQVAAVQAMPGVSKIVVNQNANATLATLAIDPSQDKFEVAPGAQQAVAAIAKAAS